MMECDEISRDWALISGSIRAVVDGLKATKAALSTPSDVYRDDW